MNKRTMCENFFNQIVNNTNDSLLGNLQYLGASEYDDDVEVLANK